MTSCAPLQDFTKPSNALVAHASRRTSERSATKAPSAENQAWLAEFDDAVALQAVNKAADASLSALAKRITVCAHSHGLLSLAATDWLFGVLQLRSA